MSEKEITILAQTNFRNQRKKFGIKLDDRRRHIYIIGKTGVGKTVFMENMIISDIKAGHGLTFMDPHGDTAEKLLNFIPPERIDDVVYFDPSDMKFPIAFNPLETESEEHRHLMASGILGIFKKIWPDVWSARMEYILNNSLMALIETPGATLLEIMRLLTDEPFRKRIVDNLKDPVVKGFWTGEFTRYNERYQTEAIAPIQNKVGQFLTNPVIRNIIGQKKSSFDFRKIMDEGKILIANISRGKIGESNSALLGAMLVSKIEQAAMSRADIPEEERRDFSVYADEFQTFATESFAAILSEARKFHLSLVIGHQYIAQLPEEVRNAIFGNIGTLAVFRVGAGDAEWLEKEFEPEFTANDLVNLSKYNIYIKLMIDGITSKAFSAETLPPAPMSEGYGLAETILKNNHERFSTPREEVQKMISEEWAEKEEAEEAARQLKMKKKQEKAKFKDNCWACGEEVGLSFQPDGKRAIYCRTCLDKIKEGKMKQVSRPIKPTKEVSKKESVQKKMEELLMKPVGLKKGGIKKEGPEPPKRKGVDLSELRDSLRESLGKIGKPKTEEKEGDDNIDKKGESGGARSIKLFE